MSLPEMTTFLPLRVLLELELALELLELALTLAQQIRMTSAVGATEVFALGVSYPQTSDEASLCKHTPPCWYNQYVPIGTLCPLIFAYIPEEILFEKCLQRP